MLGHTGILKFSGFHYHKQCESADFDNLCAEYLMRLPHSYSIMDENKLKCATLQVWRRKGVLLTKLTRKSVQCLETDFLQTKMMSLHTMHGKYWNKMVIPLLKTLSFGFVRNCSQHKPNTDWEFTRHRKKPVGGGRELTNVSDIYRFNAWDNVEWDEVQEQNALQAVQKNSSVKMGEEDKLKFKNEADKFWDSFYGIHQNRFFKDRHWLFTEFSELAPNKSIQQPRSIFELGCGVGNTILPILKYSTETQLKVYGCDFSAKAIDIFKAHPEFDSKRCEIFVMDATLEEWNVPFEPNSQDIIVLIFVLSAIEPSKMKRVAENCYRYLKPGGFVLFRDYGRYDLAQLRFKSGKCLEDNLYVRGDGTMVYFFTQEEVRSLFTAVGLEEEQNVIDRRLQVNRGRMVKMYRVWIQTKYRKPAVKT